MNIVISIIFYLVCSTAGLLLLKTSLSGTELKSLSSYFLLITNYKFVLGFLSYIASFILWLMLLSRKDLSYIYPIVVGLGYVCITTAAVVILKEEFTLTKIIGAVFIGVGVVIIYMQK